MTFKNSGEMCMVTVLDANCSEGFRFVDLGNYFVDDNKNKCLITTKENAVKYGSQIKVPIYVRKRSSDD